MKRETLKTTERERRGTPTTKPAAAVDVPVRKEAAPSPVEHRDLFTMMRDMERMMEETFRRPFMGFDWPIFRHLLPEGGRMGDLTPMVDMYEEGTEVVVKAELPGIRKEHISVGLEGNTLTITGERKEEEKVERKDYLRLERSHGAFTRTLTLPEGLDTDKVHASFTDGVLEIRIPRHEGHRGMRTITVE